MDCKPGQKISVNNRCKYCIYPEIKIEDSHQEEVHKLIKIKSVLIKKLIMVEKKLKKPKA